MKIYQFKDGYRYNSDTLFLYDFIASFAPRGEILDVGAGSGILGFLLKRDFENINLTSLEIQEKNLEILYKNSAENLLECDIIHADFSEFKSEKRFDYIVSNPPFYRDGLSRSENLHKDISRSSHALTLQNFIKNANSHLKPNGELIFCYKSERLSEICAFLCSYKLNLLNLKFIYPKYGKNANLALFRAKKSSRSSLVVEEPLYMYDGQNYTAKATEIFKKAGLESIDM